MARPRLTADDLRDLLATRVVVFDGAMGTQLQARALDAAAFGGAQYLGCNEALCLHSPDVVRAIHVAYLEAGADVVETNTFGATPLVLAEYGLGDRALEINRVAAQLACEAAAGCSDRPRLVAGSMGPTTRSLSVTGGISFEELAGHYAVQAEGLLLGGADMLLVETAIDTLNVKAALVGIERATDKLGVGIPLVLSCTVEQTGTMLAGQTAEAFHVSVEHATHLSRARGGGLAAVGLNCATGPEAMADHVRALAALSPFGVLCMPNAGLPDERGLYRETPDSLARKLARFLEHGFLNAVGGCCGTTPAHIRAIAEIARSHAPRVPVSSRRSRVAGVELVDVEEARPVIVGERTNVIGSRAFKRLIAANQLDEAAEIGRKQVRGGAHIVDVCLADPDRDERADAVAFLDRLTRKVRAPLMIDSTDAAVIEAALQRCQGKAVINSINLEDGLARFERVVPLLKRYGGAVVVGCIDDDPLQGMAVTAERKLAVAERSHALLAGMGIADEDIIFDALVFPVGTGDAAYVGAARATIEGVAAIKARLPHCRTLLGISNVSFGLPDAGREVLNTVFLHRCFNAGLDLAIVNAEKLERVTHLPPDDVALCERLLAATGADYQAALGAFTDHFKDRRDRRATTGTSERASLPLDQRIAACVVDGSREGLVADLDEALAQRAPLEIINGPLLAGMAEVGRLFAANQLIVAEVLQSAEVMKAAVAHLTPHLRAGDGTTKATMLLATVRGDVHDIGKNLVEIIFSTNGYRVIDLGIKVPPAEIVRAAREHRPDCVGLSGLLVKSTAEMVATAEELTAAGIDAPLFVGGAALSERFATTRIAGAHGAPVLYARDAMAGLALANRWFDPSKRLALAAELAEKRRRALDEAAGAAGAGPAAVAATPVTIVHEREPPPPPDTRAHVVDPLPLEELWTWINPKMLYTRHLGLKGDLAALLEQGDQRARELHAVVRAVEDEVLARDLLRARAVWRFFRAVSEGDAMVLQDGSGGELARFTFRRQPGGERRCLADLVPPRSSGLADHVALFVTTCQGRERPVRQLVAELKDRGELLRSHVLASITIETAEAAAEWLHARLRTAWGIGDPPGLTRQEAFSARYRGRRYSFGYAACPNLDDQATLFSLLDARAAIGVSLTEGMMMDPEASVSAMVFHHPQASYFAA
ncbi:MAG: methionine synthase [Deltaproteobacteria bacterium]|nr:methionine synthase [Deltaproteobacteria bacterium]